MARGPTIFRGGDREQSSQCQDGDKSSAQQGGLPGREANSSVLVLEDGVGFARTDGGRMNKVKVKHAGMCGWLGQGGHMGTKGQGVRLGSREVLRACLRVRSVTASSWVA